MLDEEMILLMIHNPNKGLNRLMDQYLGLIHTIVRSKLAQSGTNEDIEECVSDIFLDFYKSIAQIDLTRGSIKVYLSVIAKRKAIDLYRKLIKKPLLLSINETDYLDCEDNETNVEEAFASIQEKDSLIKGIRSLGEPDTEIFIRKYYVGQSTKEIAKAVSMKENTVDKRISRGLQKLKTVLGGAI